MSPLKITAPASDPERLSVKLVNIAVDTRPGPRGSISDETYTAHSVTICAKYWVHGNDVLVNYRKNRKYGHGEFEVLVMTVTGRAVYHVSGTFSKEGVVDSETDKLKLTDSMRTTNERMINSELQY